MNELIDARRPVPLAAQDVPAAVGFDFDYITVSPVVPGGTKPTYSPQPPQTFSTFAEAFAHYKRRILLLGIPGSGKTTTLLETAKIAAQSRLTDVSQPVPFFMPLHQLANVTNWEPKTLFDLLQAKVPEIDFSGQNLLFIFDGLDELGGERPIDPQKPEGDKYDPRKELMKAVIRRFPDAQIVISCRMADYEQIGYKLGVDGAVTLLPLSPEKIEMFLRSQGQEQLWQRIRGDKSLLSLARTPLLLTLLSAAVNPGEDLQDAELLDLNEVNVFDLYIRKRFEHEKTKRDLLFDEAKTRELFGAMAAYMWKEWDYPSRAIDVLEMQTVIGEHTNTFLTFAKQMHLLTDDVSGKIEFLHLELRDVFAIPSLIRALHDKDRCYVAIEALGKIGYPAVPALMRALKDKSKYVSYWATEALGKVGQPAVPALIRALKDKSKYLRYCASRALGMIQDPAGIPALTEASRDTNEVVRLAATKALGKIGQLAVPSLIRVMEDANEDVRIAAARALRQIQDPASVSVLIHALSDSGWKVRFCAVLALREIQDSVAVPALINALADMDQAVRLAAGRALGRMGQSAVPSLIRVMEDGNEDIRVAAARILREIDDPANTASLIHIRWIIRSLSII